MHPPSNATEERFKVDQQQVHTQFPLKAIGGVVAVLITVNLSIKIFHRCLIRPSPLLHLPTCTSANQNLLNSGFT